MRFILIVLLSLTNQAWCSTEDVVELKALQKDFSLYKQQTEAKIALLEDKLSQYEDTKGTRALPETSVCGFTAYKTENQNIDPGNTVYFTQTLQNFQEAYSTQTSRFTCPSTAVYFVTVSLERSNDVETVVMVNTERQFSVVDTRGQLTNLQFNSVTNSGLVFCEFEQDIWVEATDNGEIFGSTQDNERVSSFTVFRLNYELPLN